MSKKSFINQYIEDRSEHDPVFKAAILEHDLSDRIKERRKQLGLTQADVAARMGIPRERVVTIENKPLSVRAERLAHLGVVLGFELIAIPKSRANQKRTKKSKVPL